MQIRLAENNRLFVRIDPGEPIISTLTEVLKQQDIRAGSISGIGAVSSATLRFFDVQTKQYSDKEFTKPLEIASMMGNVSLKNNDIWPHLHVVLADDAYQCIGGHLHEATVGVTCEIIVDSNSEEIGRTEDTRTGMMTWCLVDG